MNTVVFVYWVVSSLGCIDARLRVWWAGHDNVVACASTSLDGCATKNNQKKLSKTTIVSCYASSHYQKSPHIYIHSLFIHSLPQYIDRMLFLRCEKHHDQCK